MHILYFFFKICNEARILNLFTHENIIKFEELIQSEEFQCFMIITEYFESIDLKEFTQNAAQNYDITKLQSIISQILSGLEHIHQNKTIHRDFNVTNILINTQENRIKIIDFGLSKQINTDSLEYFSPQQGNPFYRPPDFIEELNNVFFEDIWGYCAIVVSLLIKERVSSKKLSRIYKEYQENQIFQASNGDITKILRNIDASIKKIRVPGSPNIETQENLFNPLSVFKR